MSKKTNIVDYPVMKQRCGTCPFNKSEDGKVADSKLVNRIQNTILKEGSQICHHPRLSGKDETHLCRGARDFQLDIFHKIGLLKTPTDDCWNEKRT